LYLGKRQVPYNAVETLLCYGLFSLVDPHHFGGANMDQVPATVGTLAVFFRRTPGSIISKMLNLDGSRQHSAREEPLLFAYLASQPEQFTALYKQIMSLARNLGLSEVALPDFLHALDSPSTVDELLGQDELPGETALLLAGTGQEVQAVEQVFGLGGLLTEKLVERKIRLAQHRFAHEVLQNCGRACVFCGFAPHSLPERSGLLRASHIKPWAVSNQHERVDVFNGLTACPLHDAAFDQGYLTVDNAYQIRKASVLLESVERDYRAKLFFEDVLSTSLLLPIEAKLPGQQYLDYHQHHCFRG
jgi:putative restriction endonuclease